MGGNRSTTKVQCADVAGKGSPCNCQTWHNGCVSHLTLGSHDGGVATQLSIVVRCVKPGLSGGLGPDPERHSKFNEALLKKQIGATTRVKRRENKTPSVGVAEERLSPTPTSRISKSAVTSIVISPIKPLKLFDGQLLPIRILHAACALTGVTRLEKLCSRGEIKSRLGRGS